MMNPLLLELYCRFRCHGSEKFGSVCTQNTLTTASMEGTTLTTWSHRGGGSRETTARPDSPCSPLMATTWEPRRMGEEAGESAGARFWRRVAFLGRPLPRRGLGEAESGISCGSSRADGEGAPDAAIWKSMVSATAFLVLRPRFRFECSIKGV